MKLTGNLKSKVDNAKNKEEAKGIIEEAGMLLDDDELEQVSGGLNMDEYRNYIIEAEWDSKCIFNMKGSHKWEVNPGLKKYVCPECRCKCSDREPSEEELGTRWLRLPW